jgi:ATPase subunit of ABC transporter with duplicated ATPase domains
VPHAPGRPEGRYALCGKNGAGKSTLLRLLGERKIGGLPALRMMYIAQVSPPAALL